MASERPANSLWSVVLDTWVCWLCRTSLLNKDHVHPRFSSMRSVFSRLLTRLSQSAGSIRDSITRVFPSVSQVPSALCPGVTGFHQLSLYGSVRRCFPVLDAQRVPSVPESGSKHDWHSSHDRSSHSVHREAHLCAAFSRHLSRCYPLMDRPAVLRWLCADETCRAQ